MVKIIILAALSLLLASPLLISVIQPDGSMIVNGSGDGLWHISLVSELKKQIPPTFPGMVDIQLKNYHYFSDFIWALISKVTGISSSVVYFQIGSVIVCLALVYTTFILAKYFTKSNFWSIVSVITALFLGSASFLKPFFIKGSQSLGNNFMLDQPYDQLINLHTGVGFILIMGGTLLTFKWLSKGILKFGIWASFVFAILFGFKTFFAIPMALAFGTTCLLQIKKTKFKSLIPAAILVVLSLVIYLSISDKVGVGSGSPIKYRPGWLLTKMIEDNDRFNLDGYYLKQLHYESMGSQLRLVQMEVEKLFIFILGNYWIKLLGLFYLVRNFKKFPKENIFLSLCILFSVLLTLLIVPEPDPFNAIQFGQISVLFIGLLFGLFLFQINRKVLLIPLILFFGIIFYKDFFTQKRFNEYIIPAEEVSALKFIKNNTSPTSVIMVDPIFNNKKMKVTAIGERRTFYTGENVTFILGIDDLTRKKAQSDFFAENAEKEDLKKIVSDNKIDYIYSSTPSIFQEIGYEPVFSNTIVHIYKTDIN